MSLDPTESPRFCLRDLPLSAKVVITCFLISVGLGYTAAMVQLHFQDSKSGEAMPTVSDVVLKFTGKKWFKTEADVPKPASKFVKLISAPEEGLPFNGSGTMSPAFFSKDDDFNKISRTDESKRPQLRAEHEGERDVLVLWAKSPSEERQKAYQDDHFPVKSNEMPKTITKAFVTNGAVKVKSIIDTRCTHCHGKGNPEDAWPLQSYEQIAKYLDVPLATPFKSGGDWVKVEEPIGLEKLTQSTHAHLLSFAVLFALTGFVFAFTSYPASVRCVVGPWVLLAIVTDVAFWWLARLSDGYGVYFAMGVLGTGGAAGLGLAAQITLSLWNMYGAKGKIVLFLLFATGGAIVALVGWKVVWPGLEKKQAEIAAVSNHQQSETLKDSGTPVVNPKDKKDKDPLIVIAAPLSKAAQLLTFPIKGPDGKVIPFGNGVPWAELKFKKDQPGSMVRAFFDKDKGDFADALKADDLEAQKKLWPERHGERQAMLAWIQLAEAERKKAYDADAFDLPAELAGKPMTKDFVDAGKVKIKALVTKRCFDCHESKDEELQFDSYESFRKYLVPMPAAKP